MEINMKIAILGAGAMGCLFGGYLSRHNEVWLIEIDEERAEAVNRDGVRIREADGEETFYPKAVTRANGLGEMDLVIVFVKAMFSEAALKANRGLIGPDTYVMTLQNGAGHEQNLLKVADRAHVIIGTTKHNSSLIGPGYINHGGGGVSSIGLPDGGSGVLAPIAENFTCCGFDTIVSDCVKKTIWKKLFVNVSASVVTGILQTSLDFIGGSSHAWALTEQLAREAVRVANTDHMGFDEEEIVKEVRDLVDHAHNGYTSIYADLRDGVPTEVDTISGAVLSEAKRLGVPAPAHSFVVELVHALEDRTNGCETDVSGR